MRLEPNDLPSADELNIDLAPTLALPVFSVTSNSDHQGISPPEKLISAWDGPALFSSLAAFGIFISLAFLSQPDFDTDAQQTTLAVSLTKIQSKKEPVAEPEVKRPKEETLVPSQVKKAVSKTQTNTIKETEVVETTPPPTQSIDYSLIQSIIGSEPNNSNPLGVETQKNTGPHNTVFDNKFRQYLHSEELKEFNRRRESVDIGNFSNSEGEHFSDGNGNCFKIIDNQGETMWVRKTCLKKQKREIEFGRLKLD